MTLARAYELRARLRPFALTSRSRDCGRRAISAQPAVVVREFANRREAWWMGVLKCGRQHSCPVCAARKAADRADELDRMMRGDSPDARWQMLTLTMRHHAGESLRDLVKKLFSAWRKVRAGRAVRSVFARRVTASVRAFEVTWGANGWHPHLHLLLRTDTWTSEECGVLEAEWLRHVPASRSRAVVWSSPIEAWHKSRARYIAKLGAEVAGVAKECKNGNLTAWQIAERAITDERFVPRWREYQEAMRGRRTLEFDERAKALLEAAPEPEQPLQEWRIDIWAEEFSQLAKLETSVPGVLWEVLETARNAGPDPPTQVRITVDDACELASFPRFSAAASA